MGTSIAKKIVLLSQFAIVIKKEKKFGISYKKWFLLSPKPGHSDRKKKKKKKWPFL